jgi:uncharacterized protein
MIWRRLDCPGHEWGRLSARGANPVLSGIAFFVENEIPARLDYAITCSPAWETLGAQIKGWVGDREIELNIERSASLGWSLNGEAMPEVSGCADIDLSFSPSTNLLPIRRLNLEIGQEAEVRAAWLVFPELAFQPLVQWLLRESESVYAYRSDNGFSTRLTVDGDGFVTDYPPLWTGESFSG